MQTHAEPTARNTLGRDYVEAQLSTIFGEDLHALTVLSLANAVTGILHAATLSIHLIGQAYAQVAGILPRSGVKQVDRLLSNPNLSLESLLERWARFLLAQRTEAIVAIDWTDFAKDDHTTLCVHLITTHGRATPLLWKTVAKSSLKGNQARYESEMLERLRRAAGANLKLTVLADRGFGGAPFLQALTDQKLDYVVRFRGEITVARADEDTPKRADERVRERAGRAQRILDAKWTHEKVTVPSVVLVRRKGMQDAWCLASSLRDASAQQVIAWYSKRFTIEESFRDQKDLHFGMGLSATHIRSADRRDRLLLLVAMAITLLTLLGAASEQTGMDKMLKANTVTYRTHSLFRQGLYWYGCIPTMRKDWLLPLMKAFDQLVRDHAFFSQIFEVI